MRRRTPGRGRQAPAGADWFQDRLRTLRRDAVPVAALGLAATACGIGQAAFLTLAVAGVLRSEGTPIWALGMVALFALLRAGVRWLGEVRASRIGISARRALRDEAMARILAAGPAAVRGSDTGTLLTAVVDRVEALDGYFSRWQPAALLAITGPPLVLAALLAADPISALLVAAAGLFVPLGMALAGIGAAVQSRRQFVALARLQARFLDRLRGIGTIVLAGRAEGEAKALAAAAEELRRRTMRVLRVAFLSSAALDLALAASFVAVALRFAPAFASGAPGAVGSGLGTALFAFLLLPEFFLPLRGFAAAYQDRLALEAAKDALLALPEPPPIEPAREAVRTVVAQGVTIAFDRVTYTWDPARGPALREVSFRVPAGETLVLAGPSGAGKSTVFELLLGFVRPDSGRITLNGADIASVVPEALARMTAWVGQRPMLFAGTIRENIRLARLDASDQDVEAAARRACVTQFSAALPHGLDTPVGEGGYGLSGGQAQRIAIARAYLRDAPLLLLDEPTAHLDPGTETEVLASLRRLAIGRTCILASHSALALAFPGRRLDLRDGQVASTVRGAA